MSNHTKPETPVGGPRGDTGDGNTGVPANTQGMSNRPGDRAQGDGADSGHFQDEEVDEDLEVLEAEPADDPE